MNKNLRKYFFMSIMFCFFFISLIMGFTIVEKNVQKIILGQNLSLFSYNFENSKPKFLKIHFVGKDFIFNFK